MAHDGATLDDTYLVRNHNLKRRIVVLSVSQVGGSYLDWVRYGHRNAISILHYTPLREI